MSIFGAEITQARPVSEGASPTRPPADQSGAVKLAGLVNAGNALSAGIASAVTAYKAPRESYLNQYVTGLTKIQNAARQGLITPTDANTRSNALYNRFTAEAPNPKTLAALNEVHAKLITDSTSTGRRDPAQKAYDDLVAEAAKEGLFGKGASDMDVERAVLHLQKRNNHMKEMEHMVAVWNLAKEKGSYDEFKAKKAAQKSLFKMVQDSRPIIEMKANQVGLELQGLRDDPEAYNAKAAEMKDYLQEYRGFLQNFRMLGVEESYVKGVETILDNMEKRALEFGSGKLTQDMMETQRHIDQYMVEQNLKDHHLEAYVMLRMAEHFKNVPNSIIQRFTTDGTFDIMVEAKRAMLAASKAKAGEPFSENDDPDFPNVTKKEGKAYVDAIYNLSGTYKPSMNEADWDILSSGYRTTLESMATDTGRLRDKKQVEHLVRLLNHPNAGEIIERMKAEGLDDEKMKLGAQKVFSQYYTEAAKPLIQKNWFDAVRTTQRDPRIKGYYVAKQTPEGEVAQQFIEAKWDNGIKFQLVDGAPPYVQEKVDELNENMPNAINTIVRAEANLRGDSEENVYNLLYAKIFTWPDETSQQAGETSGETGTEVPAQEAPQAEAPATQVQEPEAGLQPDATEEGTGERELSPQERGVPSYEPQMNFKEEKSEPSYVPQMNFKDENDLSQFEIEPLKNPDPISKEAKMRETEEAHKAFVARAREEGLVTAPEENDQSGGYLLDYLAGNEGTLEADGNRGYNETLDYGAYTGGEVQLTSMSLNEVIDLQGQMLNHPKNKHNSSALGRYQITRRTLKDMMGKMGLKGEERFDAKMQDAIAMELLERRGLSKFLDGKMTEKTFFSNLQKEWEGLKRSDVKSMVTALRKEYEVPAPQGGTAKLVYLRGDRDGIVPELEQAVSTAATAVGVDRIEITSGYRTKAYNAMLRKRGAGNAKNSNHTRGTAMDLRMPTNPEQRENFIRELAKAGVKRFIIYSGAGMKNIVHIDMGTTGLEGKNAHFMYDKTNKKMHQAPAYWRRLEREIG